MAEDLATPPVAAESPSVPNTVHPPFVYLLLTDDRGLVVESNLDPTRKLAFLKVAEALTLQQVVAMLMPKKPVVVKPNGLARRIFGR